MDVFGAEVKERERKMIKDIKAKIFLYKTEDGGKKLAIKSGFSSPIKFNEKQMNDARYWIIEKEEIKPGEFGDVYLGFACPDLVRPYISIGSKFKIWEMGIKGEGEILKILEIDDRIKKIKEREK